MKGAFTLKHLQSADEFAELKNSPEKHIFLFQQNGVETVDLSNHLCQK